MFKGWNPQAHRELPGKFESSNLSRDNVSREIGRMRAAPLVAPDVGRGGQVVRDSHRHF